MRARLLAGAATFMVAAALPSAALAQLGACPTLQPPPCIIADAKKIVQTVGELQKKKEELEIAKQQYLEDMKITGVLGTLGSLPPSPQMPAYEPINPGEPVTVSEAANRLDALLRSADFSVEGNEKAAESTRLLARAAAGEGFATAYAAQQKLLEFDLIYNTLFGDLERSAQGGGGDQRSADGFTAAEIELIKASMKHEPGRFAAWMKKFAPNGVKQSLPNDNMSQDWKTNSAAKLLLLNAYRLKREVQATHLQLSAMQSLRVNHTSAPQVTRTEAPAAAPLQLPKYNLDLASLANAATKLLALKGAADVVGSLMSGKKANQDTQATFKQIADVARASQANLEALAANEARRKGVSAAALMAKANQIMGQYDRTTWDDPNKAVAAKAAADRVERELDRMVSGDVSDHWSRYLTQRAEAYKQEAFFRPYAASAIDAEKSVDGFMADYEKSIGVRASDPAALNAAIAAAQAEVNALTQQLGNAPPDVVRLRDQILASTGFTPRR